MNNKILRHGFILLFLSLALTITCIITTNLKYPEQSLGQLVFDKTFAQGDKVDKIVLSSNNKTVTLVYMDNYWRIAETGGYYANKELLTLLLKNINTSTFIINRPYSNTDLEKMKLGQGQCLNIETYKGQQKLNQICIGQQTESGLTFALLPKLKEIWLIDGNWQYPKDLYSWIMQPLLELSPTMIEKIKINQQQISRNNQFSEFSINDSKNTSTKSFLDVFTWLPAIDVKPSFGFNPSEYKYQKEIELTSFDGLKIQISLFYNEQNYWTQISFSTTPLPTAAVNAYIKDNAFLYDGWYFKIPPSEGKIMSTYELKPQQNEYNQ